MTPVIVAKRARFLRAHDEAIAWDCVIWDGERQAIATVIADVRIDYVEFDTLRAALAALKERNPR
jgi:hypothetical protein